MKESGTIILYHGSKSGIKGNIEPKSRENCDFGKGFYMGTEPEQPLPLIRNFPKASFYTLELDLEGLEVLDIDIGVEWALLIAFNRGKMESVKGSRFYEKYANMMKGYDVVAGYIADDRMFVVLDSFFRGEITDRALVESLSVLKL